jgi:CheY-like chemotaxis protein
LVCVDPGRLEQVLMNLVVNARDAMPGGGEVTIETRDVVIVADAGPTATPPPGEWVMIAIRDTGTGMTEETRANIFDPFFTTKELGRGTGLGLATVAAIVSQAGGHVLVDTLVGSGSTFSVYLPRVTRPRPVASPEPTRAAGGTETVLLVEDDHRVRAVALRVLVRSGYVVLEAGSGEEALTRVADAGRIDLLLTDVVMPGMRGTRLATELRALRPTLKVLFMSGYADDDLFAGDRVGARPPLVTKPFTPSSLLAAIRSVLDAPLSM